MAGPWIHRRAVSFINSIRGIGDDVLRQSCESIVRTGVFLHRFRVDFVARGWIVLLSEWFLGFGVDNFESLRVDWQGNANTVNWLAGIRAEHGPGFLESFWS